MSPRLVVAEAAAVGRKHPDTLRKALADGTLHGEQRAKGGPWLIREECLDAWLDSRPCAHQDTTDEVSSLDERRARRARTSA